MVLEGVKMHKTAANKKIEFSCDAAIYGRNEFQWNVVSENGAMAVNLTPEQCAAIPWYVKSGVFHYAKNNGRLIIELNNKLKEELRGHKSLDELVARNEGIENAEEELVIAGNIYASSETRHVPNFIKTEPKETLRKGKFTRRLEVEYV